MLTYFYVAIGGAIGSVARYVFSAAIARGLSEVFPWGTLIVNITGCFIIGLFAMLTGPDGRVVVAPDFRQFFMVGICGGYTTFSSFSLQTLALARDGDMTRASLNVVASVVFCLLGVWLGSAAGTALNQLRGT
jgi:fluoride exporter